VGGSEGVHAKGGRVAAWDGLRGIAVVGVLAYHLGLRPVHGGFLGVSAFFTLSGFLITSLLLEERRRTGGVSLGGFWARRLRRLLPAACALVVLVLVLGRTIGDGTQLANLRGDLLAMLAYVANWRFLVTGQSYGGTVLSPSLVLHAWSLSIEEQFYVVFPLAVVAGLKVAGRRGVAAVIALLVAGSVVATVLAAGDPQRVYFSTTVRALEILIGAAFALLLASRLGPAVRRGSVLLGVPALALILLSWTRATETSPWLARGGFAAHAVATGIVVVAAGEATRLGRWLSWRPLAWIGGISYGLYLYHWPLFLWLTPRRLGTSTLGAAPARLAVTFAVALVSFHFLEQPVRTRRRPARATLRTGFVATASVALAVVLLAPVPSQGGRIAIVDGLVAPAAASAARTPAPAPSQLGNGAPAVAPSSGAASDLTPATGDTAGDLTPATGDAGASTAVRMSGDDDAPPPTAPPTSPPTSALAGPARPDPLSLMSPLLPNPLPTPLDHRPRVLVVGDSAAATLGNGLQRWGLDTGAMDVWVSGWIACPITRGGQIRWVDDNVFTVKKQCDAWPSVRAADLRNVKPDVVVVLSGTWEVTDRKLAGTNTWRHIGDPVLDRKIAADLGAFTDLQRSRGARVLWLLHPEIRTSVMAKLPGPLPEEDQARMDRLNDIIRVVAASRSRTYTLDLPAYLRTEPGGGELAHRPDGFHWSKDGAYADAQWLGPVVADLATVKS
jgi:peptidoglycan/LPS O-acetylase OafA/YrhL